MSVFPVIAILFKNSLIAIKIFLVMILNLGLTQERSQSNLC